MRAALPIACLAAALLMAGRASAQATPETPGPAGAETAVTALVQAQRTGDWNAVAGLLHPTVVADLTGVTRRIAEAFRDALADSAAVAGSIKDDGERARTFQMARRFLAVVSPDGDALADAEVVARVLAADAPSSYRLSSLRSATRSRVLGSVAESDTLAHVLVRFLVPNLGDTRSVVERATLRWTGAEWVVQIDGQEDTGVLLDYLRFSTHNWIEVVGHIAEGRADTERAPANAQMSDE